LAELLLTCFVIGIFVVGIYKGKSILGARKQVHSSVATQLSSGDEHAAQKNHTKVQTDIPLRDTTKQYDSLTAMQTIKPKPATKKLVIDSSDLHQSAKANTPVVIQTEKKDETSQTASPTEDQAKKDVVPIKKEIVPSIPELHNNNAPPQEEKRGFLKGLFKKKKKEENPSTKTGDQ